MNSRAPVILLLIASLWHLSCQRPLTVTDADKALLVHIRELEPYGYVFENPSKYEKYLKSRDFDGTLELEYEFDAPESEDNSIYLNAVVTISRSRSNATVSQGAEKIGLLYGLKLKGVVQEERKDFYRYGDASSFFVLKKDGLPIGNYFTVREGTKTYSLVVAGVYFDDPELWKELVESKLKKFSAYKP
jgi:hypothetical protein